MKHLIQIPVFQTPIFSNDAFNSWLHRPKLRKGRHEAPDGVLGRHLLAHGCDEEVGTCGSKA